MKAVLAPQQSAHDPQHFMANGALSPNPETPARITTLHAGAIAAGCTFTLPEDHGLGPIAAIHSAEYLTFLRTAHARWSRIPGASPEVIPNIHPANRTDSYPKSVLGQAGFHQTDTSCPISSGTWQSAYWSAQTALTAAEHTAKGQNTYALCRPPGHHAFADLAGGFCFLNNAAIAAEHIRKKGLRPAILDIDVHHGNGTQGIFYTRNDVLTVSIHADPIRFYPFFWGHAHERGTGAGQGYNLNLPVARGTGDKDYLTTLTTALEAVDSFGTDVLVVALGLDAHENDPFQGLRITTQGFTRIAEAIAAKGLPLLIVQEGGYISDDLGPNLTAFLAPLKGRT